MKSIVGFSKNPVPHSLTHDLVPLTEKGAVNLLQALQCLVEVGSQPEHMESQGSHTFVLEKSVFGLKLKSQESLQVDTPGKNQ